MKIGRSLWQRNRRSIALQAVRHTHVRMQTHNKDIHLVLYLALI